ncbi:hypothetical protein VTI28DRAFT_89 [Corynascus sepedonium]
MRIFPFYLIAALGLSTLGEAKNSCSGSCTNPALEQCLTAKRVPFKVSCSPDWELYSTTLNRRVPITPAAIVLPNNSKHVSDAVICAANKGFKVQAKSGGHSYGSFGFGGTDGHVMIDLRNLNKTVLSRRTNVAVVGGGTHLGPMATAVHAQGKRAISHGICGGVGIGGHATHGGWGFTSRAWGLTLDHILELQVVLANGTETRASPNFNPDLFWALRGAADSIGIVTSFSLKTHPAPKEVVNFIYEFEAILESVDKAVNAFTRLQDFVSNATLVDRRLSLALQTFVKPNPETGSLDKSFVVGGTFLGSLSEYKRSIEPKMLRGLPEPTKREVQSHDWLESLARLSPDGTLTGGPLYSAYFANSVTVDDPGLDRAALERYFGYILEGPPLPPVALQSNMELWGGADGQINVVPTTGAAFPHRNVFWTAHNLVQAPPDVNATGFPPEAVTYLSRLRNAILDGLDVNSAAYPNLVDTTLTRQEAHQLYYGEDVLRRLRRIKAAYDPRNVFENPQSIVA